MNRHRNVSAPRSAFSLVELMVVVVIIGLLAALVVPNVFRSLFRAKDTIAAAQITEFKRAIDTYRMEHGEYPESLEVLVLRDDAGDRILDTKQVPLDPWKHSYHYEPPTRGLEELVLCSFGADGAPGGEGHDADIHWDG